MQNITLIKMPKIYNLQLNYGCLFQTKCTQKCFWNCGYSKFLHTFYMIFFFKGSCSNEVALAAWSKELTKDRSEVKEVINGWVMTSQVCEQLSAGQNFSIKHPPLLQTIQETAFYLFPDFSCSWDLDPPPWLPQPQLENLLPPPSVKVISSTLVCNQDQQYLINHAS